MSGLAPSAAALPVQPLSPEQRSVEKGAEAGVLSLRITGPLDEAKLRRSLTAVAAQADVLHTAFVDKPGFRDLRALLLEAPAEASWIVRDLRGRAAEAEIERDLAALRAPPFAVARGETLRAGLWRIGDEDWRLAIAASPLVADGGGLALIGRALDDVYTGGDGTTSSPAMPYADYARWRQEMEADDDVDQGRRYWRDHLDAADAAKTTLAYRLDRALAPGRGVARLELDTARATRLAAFADRQEAGGIEAVLQAAWGAHVGRLCGQDHVVVGWRHDCRRDYDVFAGTIGRFEKIIPLRLAFDPAESFASWLTRVARCLDDHRGWQEHLPSDALDRGRRPAVGFGLSTSACAPGRHGWSHDAVTGIDDFELELRPELDGGGRPTALTILYDAARYDAAAVGTLLEQMATLCETIPGDAARPLHALSAVGPIERARHLRWDRSDIVPPARELPLQAILRVAGEKPHAPAIDGDGIRLDYATLVQRVDRLAGWLRHRGVGPEAIVALDMPRSVDMVVALLAVWRARGAYLPLDPAWPEARRGQLCDQAGAVLVLCADEGGGFDTVAPVHSFADAMRAAGTEAATGHLAGAATDAAYVLFTSGSTGTPKAVVVEQGQLASYIAAARGAISFGDRRRFALTSTVAADLGNTALFGALTQGACLVIAGDDVTRDAAAFAGFMRRKAIDCAKLAPSHLAALLEADDPVVPDLLILGGEAAPGGLVERVLAVHPECRIHNHYGPTETTVGVLVHAHGGGRPAGSRGLPLTRTLDGNVVYLLDPRRQLVPTGAFGEIHVGGAQLCRGYLGRDGAGFVDDPLRPGRRLYPTGDVASYRPDGGIEIAGRADRQVKIRGHRVEPTEVEAALARLEGVRRCAVLVRPAEGERDAALVGFVTPRGDGPDAAALRRMLLDRLPDQMVPERIVRLDALPLLPNGKIDVGRLAEADVESAQETVPPRDAVETLLRDAAAELLGRPAASLGVTDDFFDVGGHSLLVIKFVARIRKVFSLDVPPGIVFDHPTIAALATALRDRETGHRLDQVAALRLKLASLSDEDRALVLDRATR